MSSLTFDKSLAGGHWFKNPFPLEYKDHIETVKQQLAELDGQSREILFYKLINGTVMTHLSSTFSRGTSHLRLEPSSQTELYYDINDMTPEQQEEVKDPSWVGTPGAQLAIFPTKNERGPNIGASDLTGGLDGRGWKTKTTRENRAAAKTIAKVTLLSVRPPDSTASASTSAENISARISRTSDGMFFVRGKLAAYRNLYAGAQRVPTLPAACVEIKPPLDHPEGHMTIRVASKPILDADSQIIQHAQFLFHMCDTLSVVWCLGICGRWVRFVRFERDKTPKPEPTKICNGEYFEGEESITAIASSRSQVFAYLEENGCYTPTFMKWWNKVIVDVEREYNTYIQYVNT